EKRWYNNAFICRYFYDIWRMHSLKTLLTCPLVQCKNFTDKCLYLKQNSNVGRARIILSLFRQSIKKGQKKYRVYYKIMGWKQPFKNHLHYLLSNQLLRLEI